MSIEKAEVKIGTANEIGNRLDDVLEGTTKDLYRLEGASVAYRQAVQAVEVVSSFLDRDVNEGKVGLEEATLIKTYLEKARQNVQGQATQAEHNRVVQLGKVQAMQATVQIVKKFRDDEESKAKRLREAAEQLEAETGQPISRPVGMRPGSTLKERRLAEARAAEQSLVAPVDEAQSGEGQSPVEQDADLADQTTPTDQEAAPVRRGGRPKKAT